VMRWARAFQPRRTTWFSKSIVEFDMGVDVAVRGALERD